MTVTNGSRSHPAADAAPNIVLIQADQLAATGLGAYGNDAVLSPEMDALAGEGVVFERAYCNSPLCAPSRASMMTGELPSELGVYDNGATFSSSVPTFAHHLRLAGYHTALIGRMHFIGPDQLHGFEQRLTTDVYPAGLEMVPDWKLEGGERLSWYHDTDSVARAGVSTATVQRDYDEEVIFRALRHLNDRVRAGRVPFLLVASFIHPHDPYEPPAEHWNRYEGVAIDMPHVPTPAPGELDAHSRRLRQMCGFDRLELSPEQIVKARRAYYACVSYVDDHVGRLMRHMRELGLDENTIVILTSDHGDMLGEHGLWYKMSPFEQSARVPLIIHAPGRFAAQRVEQPVSLLDLAPTIVELGRAGSPAMAGRSLVPLCEGEPDTGADIFIEYLAEGTQAPQITVVRGERKLVHCPGDPDQLYDLRADPRELRNLAGDGDQRGLLLELQAAITARYDLNALEASVRASQGQRRLVQAALSRGAATSWDHVPEGTGSYIRGDFWTAIQSGRIAVQPGEQDPV